MNAMEAGSDIEDGGDVEEDGNNGSHDFKAKKRKFIDDWDPTNPFVREKLDEKIYKLVDIKNGVVVYKDDKNQRSVTAKEFFHRFIRQINVDLVMCDFKEQPGRYPMSENILHHFSTIHQPFSRRRSERKVVPRSSLPLVTTTEQKLEVYKELSQILQQIRNKETDVFRSFLLHFDRLESQLQKLFQIAAEMVIFSPSLQQAVEMEKNAKIEEAYSNIAMVADQMDIVISSINFANRTFEESADKYTEVIQRMKDYSVVKVAEIDEVQESHLQQMKTRFYHLARSVQLI